MRISVSMPGPDFTFARSGWHRKAVCVLRSPHQSAFKQTVRARVELIGLIGISALECCVHFSAAVTKFVVAIIKLPIYRYARLDRAIVERSLFEARSHLERSVKLAIAVSYSSSIGFIHPERVTDYYQRLSLVQDPKRDAYMSRLIDKVAEAVNTSSFWACVFVFGFGAAVALTPRPGWTVMQAVGVITGVVCGVAIGIFFLIKMEERENRLAGQARWSEQVQARARLVESDRRLAARLQEELPEPELEAIWRVHVATLRDSPFTILEVLAPRLMRGRFPRIRFVERDGRVSVAIDQGGLRQSAVSLLMDGLTGKTTRTSDLPLLETETGLMLPVLGFSTAGSDHTVRRVPPKKIQAFRWLGTLFARCIQENFLIGNRFSPDLYRMMMALSSEELADVAEDASDVPDQLRVSLQTIAQCQSRPLSRMNTLLQKDPNQINKEDYNELVDLAKTEVESELWPRDLATMSSSNIRWALGVVKKMAIDDRKEDNDTILPAVIIAKQMQVLVGAGQWERWRALGPVGFQESLEGCVDRAEVIPAIDWVGAQSTETQGFVRTWVQQATNEDLGKLLFVITGSYTMARGTRMTFNLIHKHDPDTIPEAHTCFKSINVPVNYGALAKLKKVEGQQIFNDKIRLLIDESTSKAGSGTGIS